jgi:hypothetical protein
MTYLLLHCHYKQNDEVNQQNWPEHWNIQEWEQSANQAEHHSLADSIPSTKKVKFEEKKKVFGYQNLNSGSLRVNPFGSSESLTGSNGPSSGSS